MLWQSSAIQLPVFLTALPVAEGLHHAQSLIQLYSKCDQLAPFINRLLSTTLGHGHHCLFITLGDSKYAVASFFVSPDLGQ